MDGSILTISLKAALTGGQIYMNRTRDFQVPAAVSFLLRQTRDWQAWLTSATLWTKASSKELPDEIGSMIHEISTYKRRIVFWNFTKNNRNCKRYKLWEPVVADGHGAVPAAQSVDDSLGDAEQVQVVD